LVRTRARICQFKQNALFLFFEQLAIETGDFHKILVRLECVVFAAVSDEPFGIQPGGKVFAIAGAQSQSGAEEAGIPISRQRMTLPIFATGARSL
jgi:hypothetical protein